MTDYVGRRRPYTSRGIRRVRCVRCGAPAAYQWSACANGNRWAPICPACDYLLNVLACRFLRLPHADALLAAYRERLERAHGPLGLTPDEDALVAAAGA